MTGAASSAAYGPSATIDVRHADEGRTDRSTAGAATVRREQELVDRFRLRMARAASRIALIVIAAAGFSVFVQPAHESHAPREVLWALMAVAAAVSVAIHRRTRPEATPLPLWAFYLWTAAVLAFDSAVVYLFGDAGSDVYLVYLLAVLFAAATLPAWGATLALGAAVAAYLAIVLTLDGAVGQAELVLRAATFAVVGLLGAYLAREQQREIAVRVEHEERLRERGDELESERGRAEALADEVERKNRDLSELLARAISAQEGERTRIARELHDGPVQALSAVSMQLGLVEEMPARAYAGSRARIAKARADLVHTLSEIRLMMRNLRPSVLDDLGLVNALHEFAGAQCGAANVRLRWEVAGRTRRLPPPVETAVFRILQEGVNNVVRHAHAREARVSIAFDDEHLCASVEDDGVGFDRAQVRRRSLDGGGVGLLGMHERAALLGGTLVIQSAPGAGTCLRARIPVGASVDA